MPRLANSSDLEGILDLATQKVYPDFPWQAPEQKGLAVLQGLRGEQLSKYDLWVSDEAGQTTGFLLQKKPVVHPITGDRESTIVDLYAVSSDYQRALLQAAVERGRELGTQFFTIEIACDDDASLELLESFGFGLESFCLSVASGTPELPENSPYSVRPSTPDDAFMIAVLNSTMLGHTLSAGRDYDLSEITFASMAHTTAQVSREDPHFAGLVLHLGEEMAGYLLLELDERKGYVADVAIEQAHWGGTAVRHLVRSGSRLIHEKGIPWYVGDISAANPRALGSAERSMGFVADLKRYGLKL